MNIKFDIDEIRRWESSVDKRRVEEVYNRTYKTKSQKSDKLNKNKSKSYSK